MILENIPVHLRIMSYKSVSYKSFASTWLHFAIFFPPAHGPYFAFFFVCLIILMLFKTEQFN